MKAVRYHDYGGPEVMRVEDVSVPAVGAGEVLVRVEASSVNPVDWKVRSGAARAILQFPFPIVPGGDIAGVVEAVGEGVTGFGKGDEVFGLVGMVGACAEFVAVDAAKLARKPASLSFEEAASLPLVALTAWQGFFADGRDVSGKKVLVHNAAGGVGSAAVQIAKAKGARVVATASPKNAEFVRFLGADEVVDFRTTPVSRCAQDIDVLLDLVGDPKAIELWALVKPGGVVIRIAGGADAAALAEEGGLTIVKTRVKPDGAQLAQIAALVDAGKVRPVVATTLPLSEIAAAHELSRGGHVRGKVVLRVAD
ncbi:MAG: NADP-dependent oxidoreductase [Aromatoleum sp.]|jgi:NADPH:quinone reductase-like Zn-dependent oxidoreductase|uniref:NADP-dependent oxidoreductase n=1 Tax=Aromatoleum sp. TaxID=2307007 RepID=UPI002894C120|nr:NADP-dependent oxidoreductase [Aromatoleum sp.]MDT3670189.1 NADP-dependent oxidoreductase [Aromatoleum sp.]